MKKLIIIYILSFALCFSACSAPGDSTLSSSSNSDSLSTADSEEGSYASPETTYDHSAIELSEESENSNEESNSESEESLEEPYVPTTQDICAEIAAMNDGSFMTNIKIEAVTAEIEELEEYLNGTGFGIFYCDLEYNGYISYGCDKDFKTASTSKLPYIKYLATLVDKGKIDIDEKLQYTASLHDSGSGILKNYSSGGYYSVSTLMDYVLRYSDNIAYKMLFGRYGLSGFTDELAAFGVDFDTYNGYGNCTAAEMGAMLYDVAMYDGSCLDLMKDAGCNASYNYQIGAELSEYAVLQKYGAIKPGNVAYHDIAIVYAPHPYILVIYTTIDYDSYGKNAPFRAIARMIDDINNALYGE